MSREKIIGKQVWVLENKGFTYICNKDKTYTVIARVEPKHTLPDGTINNDWCDHLILFDGTTQTHIREYEVVVTPDQSIKDFDCRLHQYLTDNGLYFDDCSSDSEGMVSINIVWGDWKHEHGYCDNLMEYIGYNQDDEEVTEENGSDCYSAIHFFSKTE